MRGSPSGITAGDTWHFHSPFVALCLSHTGTVAAAYTLSLTNCSVNVAPVEALKFAIDANATVVVAPFEVGTSFCMGMRGWPVRSGPDEATAPDASMLACMTGWPAPNGPAPQYPCHYWHACTRARIACWARLVPGLQLCLPTPPHFDLGTYPGVRAGCC